VFTDVLPDKIDQGVILDSVYFYALDETHLGLVLTPTCDFEHNKAELAQICAIFDAWQIVADLVRTDWAKMGLVDASGNLIKGPLSRTKRTEFTSQLLYIIGQRFPRFHWLAPFANTSRPLIVDFQVITSLPAGELADVQLLAALRSPFREQVAARYAAYMGRVGTPDFSKDETQDWIERGIEELFPST